jgi:hypothetical protein
MRGFWSEKVILEIKMLAFFESVNVLRGQCNYCINNYKFNSDVSNINLLLLYFDI